MVAMHVAHSWLIRHYWDILTDTQIVRVVQVHIGWKTRSDLARKQELGFL